MWASGHNIQQHLFTCCSRFSCLFPEMFWLCTDRRCKHSRRRCRFRASCCNNVFHCRHNKSSTVSPLLISSICHQLVLFFLFFIISHVMRLLFFLLHLFLVPARSDVLLGTRWRGAAATRHTATTAGAHLGLVKGAGLGLFYKKI
jgi:hypothetical protein